MASIPRQIHVSRLVFLFSCPPNPSINQLNFVVKSCRTFQALHAVMSSVSYYSKHAVKNVIYLFNTNLFSNTSFSYLSYLKELRFQSKKGRRNVIDRNRSFALAANAQFPVTPFLIITPFPYVGHARSSL